MNTFMIILMAVSWIAALFLLPRLFRARLGYVEKFFSGVLLFIPILGPILYFMVADAPPVQRPDMQDKGPRGSYSTRWSMNEPGMRAWLKKLSGID